MAANSKDLMIDGAIRLLATRGLQATSFNEVLDLTKTPRGSIYHHFPEGKNQMITAAISKAGANTIERLKEKKGSSASEITEYFLDLWRQLLLYSHFNAGCSVLAVTVATDSLTLLSSASDVFQIWESTLSNLLEEGGMDHEEAALFAIQLIATTEGAVVMARAERSIRPFDAVADRLLKQKLTK